jgi:hypothetical protein
MQLMTSLPHPTGRLVTNRPKSLCITSGIDVQLNI